MKATKNTRAVVVGIFVVVALLIFIGGVLTLGGQQKSFSNTIEVKAVFNDVSGLQAGNNVWLSGVKVGTIKKLSFIPTGQVEVLMHIDQKMQSYIHKDAKAKVGSDGLIGNRIVVIYGGTQTAPVISEGDLLAVESSANMEEMMATFQSSNQNLLAITNDFKEISRRLAEGQGTIGRLLKDDGMSNRLEALLATLQRASNQAGAMTQNLAAYTAQMQRKGTLTHDLVTDTLIFRKLRSSVTQIEQLSQKANEVVADLGTTVGGVQAGLSNPATPAGVLLHDEATAGRLKAIIQNLEAGTKKLDENMEALQHNFLLRGFFRKKARAEKAKAE